MKTKASPLHVFKLFYRFGFLILAVPIESIFREKLGVRVFLPLYISNIILCILLGILAVKSRFSTQLICSEDRVILSRGIFLRDKASLLKRKISLTLVLRKPHYLIFRSRKVYFFKGTLKKSIYLTANDSEKILESKGAFSHKSSFSGVFLTALGISSVIPEALAIIPLLRQATTLIGEETRDKILGFLEEESKLLLYYVPKSLRLLTLILLLVWILSLLFSILNLTKLRFLREEEKIFSRFGVLNRVFCSFKLSDISALSIRQNPLSMLFSQRLCYLHLPVKGRYGRLPMAIEKDENRLCKIREDLGFHTSPKTTLSLKPQSLWGYTYPAIFSLFFLSLLCILGERLPYRDLQKALLFPLVIISAIWFFLRFLNFRVSVLSLYEKQLSIKSFHSLSLEETLIPLSKIVGFKIGQSIFQRLSHRCTLKIYLKSPKKISFKISHVSIKKVAQLLSLCDK